MQEKVAKISGIMADDDKVGPNIDSLIKNLMVEIAKESVEDIRKQTILSRTQKLELSNVVDHDIDKEITELESLIKRLQDEIVEMSETTNKQLPSYPGFSVIEDSSVSYNEASHVSPEISNKEEPESFEPEGFPIISKDEDMLEKQVKMFEENISNIVKASNNTNEQKDASDDFRQNFNVLRNDPTKSSKSNLDLTEKPRETLSSTMSTAFNLCILPSSLKNNKLMLINNIPIESIKSSSNNAPIDQSENDSEFCDGASLNDGDTLNDTRADNNLSGDSIDNDDISRSVNEAVTYNTINNVPILLNAENPYNLPGNIENHPSTNTTVLKDTIITLLKPETVEAAKTTIMKTLENVTSSVNTCFPELRQVIPLATPTDTSEMMQTQSVTHENAIPKTDSIFKSFNRKIRKMVGRDSETSISKENHKSEDLSDNDKELRKDFPRSKSEPRKNFYTSDDDSSIIDLKNMVALSQDSPKNVIKDVYDTINSNNSKTSNSETSNIQATESSNEIINIVKTIIPKFTYDLIIDNTDKSKSFNENPEYTTILTTSLSTESDPPSKNVFQIQLVENKPVLTSSDNEMLVNTSNTASNVPDLSKKNPDENAVGSTSITSSITAVLPKFFSSTNELQENVMKAEVKTAQNVQEKKVEKDVEDAAVEDTAVEDEDDDDDDDDDDEKEDDEDDVDDTYDVD